MRRVLLAQPDADRRFDCEVSAASHARAAIPSRPRGRQAGRGPIQPGAWQRALSPTQPPEKRFSKTQVNNAGKFLLELRERMVRDGLDLPLTEIEEDETERAWEALTWWRSRFARPLSNVAAGLRYHVDKGGGRVRRPYRGHAALEAYAHADRQARARAGEGDADARHWRRSCSASAPAGGLCGPAPPAEVVDDHQAADYIAKPKSDGYRAVHLIISRQGVPIEVQLRTIAQDVWANTVEEQGREMGVGLKFGAGGADVQGVFVSLAETLASFDRGELSREELRVALRHLRS